MCFGRARNLSLLSLLILVLTYSAAYSATDSHHVKVGVLAKRGIEHCRSKWGPTADYLTHAIKPYQFCIVPLDFASVTKAVAQKEVDFILTNPSSYVELEDKFKVAGIATLINRLHSGDHTLFGGVIFTLANRSDIEEISDLSGKDFMAVDETSMGGWRMAWREMKAEGLDPHKDLGSLAFGGTHDAVVFAVQNHQVDAGTVRTDTLERMAVEGKIDLSNFRILNSKTITGPSAEFAYSTRLYPEWPMARLAHTPPHLVAKVANALFNLEGDAPASSAAMSGGWTYPLSYHSIHECLEELKVGPYDFQARQSLGTFFHRHVKWIVFGGCVFFAFFIGAVHVAKLNIRLSAINTDLTTEIEQRKTIETGLIESKFDLQSALKAANAANDSKADFLANMSHELRTPMNGIIGMTSILQNSYLTEDQAEYTQIIMKSSEGLLGIINDILDYTQIETGKSKLDSTDFDLYALVNEILGDFLPKAAEKGLVFSHMVADDTPAFLKGDARRIKKIIRILLSNALKFTQEGTISLHIDAPENKNAHCTLCINVKDTGIGIEPGRKVRIFDPFSQEDYSSTRKYGGTGLGLALAKHFSEMMDGDIGFQSTPNIGSTFWFTVPLEKQTSIAPRKRYNTVDIRGKRILIVDDNATNRQVLESYLKSWHIESFSVESGRAALTAMHQAISQDTPYDLAIIDHMMPEMDGIDLGRVIKEEPMLKEVKMILLTSIDQGSDADVIKEIGFDAFMAKPLRPSEFFNCLHLVYSQHEHVKQTADPTQNLITQQTLESMEAHGPRVLVVEDNVINQKVMLNILEGNGCQVKVVDNGRKAVQELREKPYDIVLMDLQMPEMNGFEATTAIRNPMNKCLDSNVPIIAVTANTTKGERENCLEAGMDDYLPKPVDVKILMEKIRQWYDKQSVYPEPENGAPN